LSDLATFVKRNNALKHLDLSNTEMQYTMLRTVIEAISEAQNLCAVHLDGNPGISKDLIQFT
jgi:hypothetical protein